MFFILNRIGCKNKDEVYGALSAACYVHSTQAAQKVPETKKVDDGVHSVRRGKPDEVYGALSVASTVVVIT